MEDLHIKEHLKWSDGGVGNTQPGDKSVVLHEWRQDLRGVPAPVEGSSGRV